jgi:hypothetical protein
MKPACVKCLRFFRPKKTGLKFIEGMPKHNDALPGTIEPDQWEPYKLWSGDLWECKGCGAQIISGVGRDPIAEHYEANFKELVMVFEPKVQINDC